MADVNLYPIEPKKVIGEYTEFFAGQLPTANDFNRWLAVLIAQGDYNTAWLDLVAQKAGMSINELYTELSILSEIVTPGSGTMFSQRLATLETNTGGWRNYPYLTSINPSFNLSSTSMYQIINAMVNNSNLNVMLNNTHAPTNIDIPSNLGGVLDIKKTTVSATQGRAVLRYTAYNGNTWERVCSVTDDIKSMTGWYKLVDSNDAGFTYFGVAELGLNAATCTLADIWNAMQNNSEIILDSATLPAITAPTAPTQGTIHIIKSFSARQAKIEFIPKIIGAPWFMNLSSTNVPSGTWIQYANNAEQLVTLPSTGWTAITGGFQQTVTLTGAVATSNPDWCLKPAGQVPTATEKTNDSLVENATFGANTMTFLASAIPSAELQYRVKGV